MKLEARLDRATCGTLTGTLKAKQLKRRFIARLEQPPAFTAGEFTNAPLTQSVVGASGGTITVSDPASPVNGLTIKVPPGATEEDITFMVSTADIVSADGLREGAFPTSKLIHIQASGSDYWNEYRMLNAPALVTLPYQPPAEGEEMVRFYAVKPDGSLEAAGFAAQDMEKKTVSFYLVTITWNPTDGFEPYTGSASAPYDGVAYNTFNMLGYYTAATDAQLDRLKVAADRGFKTSVFPTITINSITGKNNNEVVYDRASGMVKQGTTSIGDHKYITSDSAVVIRGTITGGIAQSACCWVNEAGNETGRSPDRRPGEPHGEVCEIRSPEFVIRVKPNPPRVIVDNGQRL